MRNFKNLAAFLLNRSFAHLPLRLTAIILLIALITPIFLFQPIYNASANTLPIPQAPSIVSVPPEAFIVPGNNSLSSSITTAFGSLLSFSNKTISRVLENPKVPTGLEQPEKQPTLAESLSAENTNANPLAPLPLGSVRFDFDGDSKADLARWKSSATEWKVKNSSNGNFTTTTIGSASSIITPGDFDGDGKTDTAVFNAGTWTIKRSSDNQTITVSFGTSGDKPVVGDFDGDGLADCAVFRPSTNTWWILKSSNASYTSTSFGISGDITAQGNFDGDLKTDIAVFRPSTGDWHVQGSTAGYFSFHWGVASDIPVPADYDGDGKTDFAVYRGSVGTWYVSKSSTNNAQYFTQGWGNFGDQPLPADYDGDGKDDFAVWRPTNGVWYLINSGGTPTAYDYQTLGQTGDTAVSSAYLKQIGGAVAGYDLAKARLSPKNETGETDLYSRNFSWGTSLVGLPGRAGMDMGFGISYNSLIWTKEPGSNALNFDADTSNVSPGFRFGFPTIEPIYWDKDALRFNYLMVAPSGARVEFRQINGASDTYETADSSYLQLKTTGASNPNDPVENISITVSGTGGTKMTYLWKAGAFRCSEIKDRNGNYITINHDEQGLLRTVTDTLGRVITVNYDAELYPSSITQVWKDDNGEGSNVAYTWASFTYSTTTVNTNFASGVNIVGPGNNTALKVLQKITYPTGAYTTFEYNGYAQVKKVTNFASDLNPLNYVETNLDNPSANQADCPRFSETRSWVKNFNQDQPVIFTNTITENEPYNLPGSISGTATKIEVSMANHPHGAITKSFVVGSGWREGLQIASEDWANGTSGSERKRWTWTNWTQDDTNLTYIQNPRVTESKVGDSTNIKRTTTEYRTYFQSTIAEYGLVSAVNVYDTDQSTILKRVETDYNLGSVYLSHRIIGLQSEVRFFGRENSALSLVSKISYTYDGNQFNTSGLEQNISPTQHDTANYGTSFVIGRGNPTSTTRYDVTGQTANVTSQIKYNTAGAAVAKIDPLNRTVKISYADKFNDGNNSRNTYAYATKLTDPADNYSEAMYRFDNGANVWAKSPTPQGTGNAKGKETERLYDTVGRLERETVVNHSGAYKRYEYPSNGIQSKIFATLTTGAGEIMSESWTDGAGRVRFSRTEHPDSTGGWSGSKVEYDILGRVTRATVPTEINPATPASPSTWTPTGDDDRGIDVNNNPVWLWNHKRYDWQGRVIREIKTDGNPDAIENDSDVFISYDGCGCAGGQVTTVLSEKVPRDDQPNTTARRKQKVYEDILGREYQLEFFDWNNNVYSTTTQKFNGRDQITQISRYAGAENPNNVHQNTTMIYDGHGRLKTRHNPSEGDLTATTWIYNSDDSIQQIIDPRGAIKSFTYGDARGLLTQISYDPPSTQPTYTNIPDSPTVQFQYDNAGNRTLMTTDGVGSTSYSYDELSRLKSETKTFTGLTGSFTVAYDYHLAGKLKSVTDPFGAVVNYNDDKAGRTTSITGSGFLDVSTYASAIKYRAFGAIKEMTYGSADSSNISYQFNSSLQVSSYQSTSTVQTGGYVRRAAYEYFSDGKTKKVNNLIDSAYTQTYKYDHLGRLSQNGAGMTTNNQNEQVQTYAQNIQYNAFNDITSRATSVWGGGDSFTADYTNGRKLNSNEIYDALGNVVDDTTIPETQPQTSYDRWKFDAAGNMSEYKRRWYQGAPQQSSYDKTETVTQSYDGDGKTVKWNKHRSSRNVTNNITSTSETTQYYVRSSILDKVLTELDAQGSKKSTNIYTGKSILAAQSITAATQTTSASSEVYWKHEDIITGSSSSINRNGQGGLIGAELEPLGGAIPTTDPSPIIEEPINNQPLGNVFQPESGCAWDYTPINCSLISNILGGYKVRWVEVNIRSELGWAGYYALKNNVSIKENRVYRRGDQGEEVGHSFVSHSSLTYVGSFYDVLISPVWDLMVTQVQRETLQLNTVFFTDVKKGARAAFDSFNSAEPNCAELAKSLGLDQLLQNATLIAPDDKLLKTTLANLKFEAKDFVAPENYKDFPKLTLGDVEGYGDALTNIKTNTIYLFGSAFTGSLGTEGSNKRQLGSTVFHELLHLKYKGNHIAIADALKLKYDKDDDTSASDAIDDFIEAGCPKPPASTTSQ